MTCKSEGDGHLGGGHEPVGRGVGVVTTRKVPDNEDDLKWKLINLDFRILKIKNNSE